MPEAVITVDTGNCYPSFCNGRIDALENGMAEGGWVAQSSRCSTTSPRKAWLKAAALREL